MCNNSLAICAACLRVPTPAVHSTHSQQPTHQAGMNIEKRRDFSWQKPHMRFFDVLLTVHLSIFILVSNQLDAQNFVLQ